MIENILSAKHIPARSRLTIKSLIALGLITLAVTLPQLAHLAIGASAGVTLLPMYLPVLLGGCLLGVRFGMCIGILSPLVSFLITSALGSPMPAAARLPFMMAELAVFALISGLFSDKISKHSWLAFPAVILAQLCGRAFLLASVALLESHTTLTSAVIWQQIKTGLVGLAIQAVAVPVSVMLLGKLLDGGAKND